ncbi:MAG: hypothetical protein EA403_05485, partial [Spirochaetaceae bacterium]
MKLTRVRALATAILLTAFAVSATAQTEWIYAAAGAQYVVVNPADGAVVHRGELRVSDFRPGESGETAPTPDIVPTPGGRYVFFLFAGSDRAIVVDAETHQPVWSVTLPAGTRRIVFSSMGTTLWAFTGGTSWIELSHQRGRLTDSGRRAASLGHGTVAFNRRATRVYGNRGSDLVFALASSGEVVQTVELQGGPHDWQISPNFRFLAGTSANQLVMVDEARGRAVGTLPGAFAGGVFHPSSREFFALSADGTAVVAVDATRATERSRIRPPLALTAIFSQADGTLHGLAPS